MKRGRPGDDYPRGEFREALRAKMTALGISQTGLADRSQVLDQIDEKLVLVSRATVARILRNEIPASRKVRIALMRTLQFEPELIEKFLGTKAKGPKPMLINDYRYPRHCILQEALNLFHERAYQDVARAVDRILDAPENRDDIMLQADAAGLSAVVNLEMFNFSRAESAAAKSIAMCLKKIGLSQIEIIRLALPLPRNGIHSEDSLASRILSDTLHNRCQGLVRQMIYCQDAVNTDKVRHWARLGFDSCLMLDRRLGLLQPAGNDLRCKSVVEIVGNPTSLEKALGLIAESEENFERDGLFEAHAVKTRGIVYFHAGKLARGRKYLSQATEMLSSFIDSRGLALTLYLLSDAILQTDSHAWFKRLQAFRCAMAAAVLHPYGLVISRCREQSRRFEPAVFQSEIDRLIAGAEPYRSVHQMMIWLASDSPRSFQDLLFRNIRLMLGSGGFPRVELPEHDPSAETRLVQPN